MTRSVPVWFDAFHVADINVAPEGDLSLRYIDRWRKSLGAFPLSVTMPLHEGPFPSAIVTPWIANLLPEEEQLRLLTRALGIDQGDALALLEEIGGDTAGALSFGGEPTPSRWAWRPLTEFYEIDDPAEALERHFEDLARRPFLVGEEGVRQSLAGGQKKSALTVLDARGTPVLRLPQQGDRLAIPLNGAPSTLIVKPDNPFLPGLTQNEAWCLKMAQAVGVQSVEAAVLKSSTRSAVAVLRYDRKHGKDGRLIRIHQEDFAQANGLPPGRKYERGTRPGLTLNGLFQTGRHVGPKDALALLSQVLFSLIVGNTDAHAKNFALMHPIAEPVRLAPLYDVSSVLDWPHVTQFFAQSIAGKRRKPDGVAGRHLSSLAREAGYRPRDVLDRTAVMIDAIVANRRAVTDDVTAQSDGAGGYVERIADLVEHNALRLRGRLAD